MIFGKFGAHDLPKTFIDSTAVLELQCPSHRITTARAHDALSSIGLNNSATLQPFGLGRSRVALSPNPKSHHVPPRRLRYPTEDTKRTASGPPSTCNGSFGEKHPTSSRRRSPHDSSAPPQDSPIIGPWASNPKSSCALVNLDSLGPFRGLRLPLLCRRRVHLSSHVPIIEAYNSHKKV